MNQMRWWTGAEFRAAWIDLMNAKQTMSRTERPALAWNSRDTTINSIQRKNKPPELTLHLSKSLSCELKQSRIDYGLLQENNTKTLTVSQWINHNTKSDRSVTNTELALTTLRVFRQTRHGTTNKNIQFSVLMLPSCAIRNVIQYASNGQSNVDFVGKTYSSLPNSETRVLKLSQL